MLLDRRLSLAEFLAMPETKPPLEYDHGVVRQKVGKNIQHARLGVAITNRINEFAEPRRLAVAFAELRLSAGELSFVPDVSVYRWADIPRQDSREVGERPLGAPPLVIEIVSPDQTAEIIRKCQSMLADGCEIGLVVDLRNRFVIRVTTDRPPQLLFDADDLGVDTILPGFTWTVGELFDALKLS